MNNLCHIFSRYSICNQRSNYTAGRGIPLRHGERRAEDVVDPRRNGAGAKSFPVGFAGPQLSKSGGGSRIEWVTRVFARRARKPLIPFFRLPLPAGGCFPQINNP
jgi:hypothetical protein